jgi:hypothetical protein
MKKRLIELACRRSGLLEKIENQRMEVTEVFQQLKKPLALTDIGLKAARFIHNYWFCRINSK